MQGEPKTPIKQDVKKGKLRFYPYNINWNYGMIPQTWEDPAHTNAQCGGVAVRPHFACPFTWSDHNLSGCTQWENVPLPRNALSLVFALSHHVCCTQIDNLQGDNDPVDVVEIGSAALEMGGVYPVKPVGVFAMIDDGELDWKVIAISTADPKAHSINDVEDVERCASPVLPSRMSIWKL